MGTGLTTPLRRDLKMDFAYGDGPSLLASKVLQALATEGTTPSSSGELPWRTAFGAGLHLLRHQRNGAVLAELARVHVRDALRRWVPEAELLEVRVIQEESTLALRVRFREAQSLADSARPAAEITVDLGHDGG